MGQLHEHENFEETGVIAAVYTTQIKVHLNYDSLKAQKWTKFLASSSNLLRIIYHMVKTWIQ